MLRQRLRTRTNFFKKSGLFFFLNIAATCLIGSATLSASGCDLASLWNVYISRYAVAIAICDANTLSRWYLTSSTGLPQSHSSHPSFGCRNSRWQEKRESRYAGSVGTKSPVPLCHPLWHVCGTRCSFWTLSGSVVSKWSRLSEMRRIRFGECDNCQERACRGGG